MLATSVRRIPLAARKTARLPFGAGGRQAPRHFSATAAASIAGPTPGRIHCAHRSARGQEDFVSNPFEGTGCEDNKRAGAVVAVEIEALDMRDEPALLNSDALHSPKGMCLLPHVSSMEDFQDGEEVTAKYHAEMTELARRLTKCDRACFASHVVRRSGAATYPMRPAAHMAHCDHNDRLKEQLLEMYAAGKESVLSTVVNEEELRTGRLVVMNFWRPTAKTPLQRNPLGLLDPTSMKVEDFLEYVHDPQPPPAVYKLPLPVLLSVHKDMPRHRWYYPSGMTRDEVLCFKIYDSAAEMPRNGVGIHGCVELLKTPEAAPPRESIEARVFCWFADA
eukprot:TRINITY_DN39370_c0_g1_i1.p1 TRINITY_DN39370_c0_g1~~TRINITY_DN39370_c0_g1_i1.p1  ORF type:complete len:335 (-),score=73.86 TRINITY_DN39370_c0_g1_i1:141-1145(-)